MNIVWKTLDIFKKTIVIVQKDFVYVQFKLRENYWSKLCKLRTTYHYTKPLVFLLLRYEQRKKTNNRPYYYY